MVTSGCMTLKNEQGETKRHYWRVDVRNEKSGKNIGGGFVRWVRLSDDAGNTLGYLSAEYCAAPDWRSASDLMYALVERFEWEVRNEDI